MCQQSQSKSKLIELKQIVSQRHVVVLIGATAPDTIFRNNPVMNHECYITKAYTGKELRERIEVHSKSLPHSFSCLLFFSLSTPVSLFQVFFSRNLQKTKSVPVIEIMKEP